MSQFALSPFLTDFSTQRAVGKMGTGSVIAPIWLQSEMKGTYGKRARQIVGATDVARAAGEKGKRKDATIYTEESFLCTDHDLTIPVPIEYGYAYGIGEEEQNAAIEAANEIRFAHELEVKNAWFGTGSQAALEAIYGTAAVRTPTTKWDAANGNPAENIRDLNQVIYKRSGVYANTAVIPKLVYDVMVSSIVNGVAERLKYTSGNIPDEAAMARMLGLQRVHVAEELLNGANPGQAESFDYLYNTDSVLLFHSAETTGRRSIGLAKTIAANMPNSPFFGVQTKYDDDSKSFLVRCSGYWDVKEVFKECGGAFYNVLST